MTISEIGTQDDAIRFPSLDSLRAAHTELLKRFRANGRTPEMVAEVERFIQRGRATGALLDADAERWAAQSQLDYWSTQLYQPGYEPPDATLDEFDPELAPELEDALCPYMGLDAFREANEFVFFGRRRLIGELVDELKDSRFLAVLGSSGSGKSSVVRAGLIPALKRGALTGSESWTYFPPMVPGSHPLVNLARLMEPEDADIARAEAEAESFRDNTAYLPQIVRERFEKDVVLVIDQFEEVFTLCTDEVARLRFVDNLIALCKEPDAGHRLIITMRSDFEMNIARLPALQDLFEKHVVRITPLSAAELREAIEAPAARIGLKFEEGVVDALLSDTLGEPAALPLLQFTLLKLWERRERNRITWESYKKLGGGRQTLANSADQVYMRLIPEQRDTMRRILLKMVRPGEGLEVTSNRVPRASLYQKAEAHDRIDRVLDRLIKERLVRSSEGDMAGDEQVEIAHEALVRNWPRLVEWLEEERVTLRQRQRLTAAAEQWQRLDRDPSALWRGVLLEEVRRYDDLNELEKEFLKAGYEAEQAEVERAAQESQKQKELEYTKRLAEAEAQSAAKLRQGRVYLLVALSIVLLLGVVAWVFGLESRQMARMNSALAAQNKENAVTAQVIAATAQADRIIAQRNAVEAEKQAHNARVGELAALASLKSSQDYDQALLFGVEALQLASEADRNRGRALDAMRGLLERNAGLRRIIRDSAGEITGVAFSADGTLLAASRFDTVVSLWDVSDPDSVQTLEEVYGMNEEGIYSTVASVAFSPVAPLMAFQDSSGNIFIWDVSKPDELSEIGKYLTPEEGGYAEIPIAFSADGKVLASVSSEGGVVLWDVTGTDLPKQLTTIFSPSMEPALSLAWDPSGARLAIGSCASPSIDAGCVAGRISLWDVTDSANPILLGSFTDVSGEVATLAFRPDGTILASASLDATVSLWNVDELSSPVRVSVLRGFSAVVHSIAFSSDGATIAAASEDEVLIWDISFPRSSTLINTLQGHTDRVKAIAFSPDGQLLASAGDDRRVMLWDPRISTPPIQAKRIDYAQMAQISADGKTLATTSSGREIDLWDISDPEKAAKTHSAQFDDMELIGYSFIPNSERLLVAGCTDLDNDSDCIAPRISILDISATGQSMEIASRDVSEDIQAVAVSPTGKIAAIAFCSRNEDDRCDPAQIEFFALSSGDLVPVGSKTVAEYGVRRLVFTPDEKGLVIDNEFEVLVWDITSLTDIQQLAVLEGNRSSILDIAVSPDGKRVALGAHREVILWDISVPDRPVQLAPLEGYSSFVSAVAFSEDGRRLAAASEDRDIILWDLSDPDQPSPIYAFIGLDQVSSLSISPDGKLLISAPFFGTITLWDIDPQSWTRKACQIAGRNFNQTEWQQYFPTEDYRVTCPQWPRDSEVAAIP